jgi:hypothetical protein
VNKFGQEKLDEMSLRYHTPVKYKDHDLEDMILTVKEAYAKLLQNKEG